MLRKKRKSGSMLLLAMAAAIAMLFFGVGCPNSGDDDELNGNENGDGNGNNGGEGAPAKPFILDSETGFELVNVNLKSVSKVDAEKPENRSAVVSFTWAGDGATSYNVYQAKEAVPPTTPVQEGLKDQFYFAKNLDPNTTYYFWIEAVNSKGKTMGDLFSKTTGKKGTENNADGMERGDYPRGLRVVPGSGSLTVSWDLSDRVGWYEVYYAPKDTIKHLDIYTSVRFRYDKDKDLLPGAIDFSNVTNASRIAYVPTNDTSGHTNAVYPFLSPLTNGSWNGYEVVDGQDKIANDGRPQIGTENTLLEGAFYNIMEIYTGKTLEYPYKSLDSAFTQATPWDGTKAGIAGTPVKFYGTSTTITGLTDDQAYDVWIRSPNANGEIVI
jgi:hypothetical protein